MKVVGRDELPKHQVQGHRDVTCKYTNPDMETKVKSTRTRRLQDAPSTATTAAMSCSIPQSCLRQLSRNTVRHGSLPSFTTSAASLSRRTQCFSTTAPAQSRIGGAAISVPPEVSLNFIDLPQTQVRGRTKEIPKTAIEIKGPLGSLWFPSCGHRRRRLIVD